MKQLFIGHSFESAEEVRLDAGRSRTVLVCGKRGSGKSYLLGVMVEELFKAKAGLIVVVDPIGVFHTLAERNQEQEDEVWKSGLRPQGFPVRILTPGIPEKCYGDYQVVDEMRKRGTEFSQIRLNVSDITVETWCEIFGIGINEPMGICLSRSLRYLKGLAGYFTMDDLIEAIQEQPKAQETTKDALINRFEDASCWGIFNDSPQNPANFFDMFSTRHINVLDLHFLDSSRNGMRNLILSVIARDLFRQRNAERLREEFNLKVSIPKIWMVIDEAQQFVPNWTKSSICKEILIRWVKEGRQPGLSMILASQQPSAIDNEVLSQCDVILSHLLTSVDDSQTVAKVASTFSGIEIKNSIQSLARTGEAIFLDDLENTFNKIKVRPRLSKPGGSELIGQEDWDF